MAQGHERHGSEIAQDNDNDLRNLSHRRHNRRRVVVRGVKARESLLAAIVFVSMACQPAGHFRDYYTSEDGRQVLWLDTAPSECQVNSPVLW